MIRTVAAVYKNGAVLPMEPLNLPDDTRLKIIVEEVQGDGEARAAFEEVSDHLQHVSDEQILQAIASVRAARSRQ